MLWIIYVSTKYYHLSIPTSSLFLLSSHPNSLWICYLFALQYCRIIVDALFYTPEDDHWRKNLRISTFFNGEWDWEEDQEIEDIRFSVTLPPRSSSSRNNSSFLLESDFIKLHRIFFFFFNILWPRVTDWRSVCLSEYFATGGGGFFSSISW